MQKYAYLIMAHNNFKVLEKLIKLIDYEKNDIYIHVDKKTKDFDKDYFSTLPKKSNIYFAPRIEINWGGLSQIICELSLLEMACAKNYSYYHLLSGADLPLKSQEYIHEFFDKHQGKEFVGFIEDWDQSRIKYYHVFNEVGRNTDIPSRIKRKMNNLLVKSQKLLNVNLASNRNFAKGANWFSITSNLAQYILEKKHEILKQYRHAVFADEVFLQTLIINSEFKDHLYKDIYEDEYENNLRHIDWKRGGPYTFTKEDYHELMNSNKLFARKFDENVDFDIVNTIYHTLKN
ncbi:beta-1,6-N-acetylglucosaminyltransferase [Bacillus marasmi]|uniref:beta-1,6-N-acetylglucosaminyltransferase n=1 Tax=Bacillus marasmi TaxID=1926279 RepID=UPI00164D5903|nr:beta-1,6-N-acetylglucosaminyltransferase [Bacillus marasmi]